MTTEAEASALLAKFRPLRRKIEQTEAKRKQLYADQNALIVEASDAGLRPVDMARAADPKAPKALSESFGQVIREEAKRRAREAGARKPRSGARAK